MNRGSSRDVVHRHLGFRPSMRPRFMNRGSALDPIPAALGRDPSMRPRFMNRGSLDTVSTKSLFASAFNEAPIHESGKCAYPRRIQPA